MYILQGSSRINIFFIERWSYNIRNTEFLNLMRAQTFQAVADPIHCSLLMNNGGLALATLSCHSWSGGV